MNQGKHKYNLPKSEKKKKARKEMNTAPATAEINRLFSLSKTIGNQAVQAMFKKPIDKKRPLTPLENHSKPIQRLKHKSGDKEVNVDIDALPLHKVYDYLGRQHESGVVFEDGDLEKLHARVAVLLPEAYQRIYESQAFDEDIEERNKRNIKLTTAQLQQLIANMELGARSGNIKNFDTWLAATCAQDARGRQDHINELREADRLITNGQVDPSKTPIDLGETAITGTTETADLAFGDTQIEVKTVREPITRPGELDGQMYDGLKKFSKIDPHADHGKYEVTIYASFNSELIGEGLDANPVVTIKVDPDTLNESKTINPPGKSTETNITANYIDTLLKVLNSKKPPGSQVASRVNIIMENAKNYFASRGEDGI